MENQTQKEEKSTGFFGKLVRELLSWIIVIGLALGAGYLINNYVILKAEIPTGSMENTLMVNDKLIGNRIAYLFSEPERGDIVMFDFPDDESKLYVKRIIGLPGDHIEIVDGKVYINNSETPLDEPYLAEVMTGSYGPYDVPEGCYFVMGDNRNHSYDARSWQNTYVSREKIECKAWFRYSPNFTWVK